MELNISSVLQSTARRFFIAIFKEDTTMADGEFFSISGLEEGIKELTSVLDEIDNKAKGEICKEAVNKAADVILNEEKRILSSHPQYVKFVPRHAPHGA